MPGRTLPALGGASVGYVEALRPAGRPGVSDTHAVVGFEAATLVEAGAAVSLLGLAVAAAGVVSLPDVRTAGDTPTPTAGDRRPERSVASASGETGDATGSCRRRPTRQV